MHKRDRVLSRSDTPALTYSSSPRPCPPCRSLSPKAYSIWHHFTHSAADPNLPRSKPTPMLPETIHIAAGHVCPLPETLFYSPIASPDSPSSTSVHFFLFTALSGETPRFRRFYRFPRSGHMSPPLYTVSRRPVTSPTSATVRFGQPTSLFTASALQSPLG